PAQSRVLTDQERRSIADGQRVVDADAAKVTIRAIIGAPRFWAIAVPRFSAEPAWQTFSFWIPLYLANERHMDSTQIAMFAWSPFSAADAGGIIGGYSAPSFQRRWGSSSESSRMAGSCSGAVSMIGPGSVGSVAHPSSAIASSSVGGFAHQMISVSINTLSADVFPRSDVAKANGSVGMAGWTGGSSFSSAIGQSADTHDGPRVTSHADTGAVAHVFVSEEDIVRVSSSAQGTVTSPPSWAVAPGQEDVAEPGRDRMD
ncbi:hypothetical protein OY671_008186, partial [Metschnikowia pulcherrima]